ncbi:hypothetical protein F5141DRAFT_1220559 [Pisolithus sp. B1]|nr:hypothetical protein F5141DRAFT_1220559 [Pisolithus sp. B1]
MLAHQVTNYNNNNSAHQDTDMGPAIANALNVSLAQDAAAAMEIESVQAALASATSTNQGGTSDAMDVEEDIGSATNCGNDGTGIEGTARQMDEATPKAKGKGKGKGKEKAKAQDGEEQGKEKKMTHAIKEVKKTPVQEMIDHIKGLVNQATLGYALMTVMDDNDLGTGPMMQRQQINLRGIDKAFMADFLKGMEVHGLQNRFLEHALDLAVHKADIDISSLQPAHSTEYTNSVKWQENANSSSSILYNGNHRFTYMREHSPYRKIYLQRKKALEDITQVTSGHMHEAYREAIRESEKQIRAGGVWLVRFLDLDFIQSHEDRALVESHMASNSVLPVHQDSEHDSLQLIMKILLDTSSPEAREKFIQQALKSIRSMNTSSLGKILRDRTLFNSVFNLFQFNHFCSRDNTGTGLSIQNIITWYPTVGGAMIYISDCCYKILHFLAMPVEFDDVPAGTPPQDIEAWFASQYGAKSQEFDKPIQLAACQVLDKTYFKHWADTFAKYMTSGEKENQVPPIDLFASGESSEDEQYTLALSKYWEVVIRHAEMEKEGCLHVQRDPISDILRLTMPAKLKALQHGLMAKIHGNKLLGLLPVPTKLLLYTLGEQLKSIQPAIKEMVLWMEPLAAVGVDQRPPLWRDHLRALEDCITTKLGVSNISRIYKYLFHARRDAFLGMNAYLEVAKNATESQDLGQLSVGTFEGAIDSYIKDSRNQLLQSGLKSAEAPSMSQLPELAPINTIDSELETVQSEYVEFLSQILRHTSFPWLEASKVKRSETLVKKLIPLFESYKACRKLLGTDAAWRVREDLKDILSVLARRGGRSTWIWYDLFVERPIKEVKDQLDKTQGPMPLGDDETEGNLYARTQQFLQLRQQNHNKIKQIIRIALSDELGLGFGGKALPEARKATEGFIKVLQQCSEMAVHRLKAPAELFRPESEEDLGELYPVDLPDAMTEKETAILWVMEKNEEQAEKDRAAALEKEHQNVKVLQAAKIRRAHIVAESMRKRQVKSRKIVLESDEEESLEGVASTSKAQQAEPSTPQGAPKRTLAQAGHDDTEASGRSPVRPRLDIGATDMSQATTTYTWEAFKGVISQAKSDTQFQKLPAILFLLLMVLELAQDKPEARVGLDRVVKELGQATESPSAQVILGYILSLKGVVGRQGVKYIKKAQDLVGAGTATVMVDVKVAAQWFE